MSCTVQEGRYNVKSHRGSCGRGLVRSQRLSRCVPIGRLISFLTTRRPSDSKGRRGPRDTRKRNARSDAASTSASLYINPTLGIYRINCFTRIVCIPICSTRTKHYTDQVRPSIYPSPFTLFTSPTAKLLLFCMYLFIYLYNFSNKYRIQVNWNNRGYFNGDESLV